MANIFQTSVTGLLAFQRALATTSHNISNVGTDGYSRQRTEFTTLTPQLGAGGWVGSGVGIDTIRRMADEIRLQAVRTNTSEFGRLDTFAQLSGRIDNLLADQKAGLAPAMQAFFNSVQAASTNPADETARNVMLTEAQNLASRFHYFDARLTELDGEVNGRLAVVTEEINQMAEAVARLNREIVVASGRSQGAPPNDLLDQRDLLLERIAQRVGTQVVQQHDGSVSVFIGNGQALVVGAESNRLAVIGNDYDGTRNEIAFVSGNSQVNISRQISGGSLGGLLDFRRESLDVIRNELGQAAVALTVQFNQQHRQGVSFDGSQIIPGGDFFKPLEVDIRPSSRNSGSGRPAVTINPEQLGELTASDYRLRYDGSAWQLTRLNDGQSWTLPANSAPDGLLIDVSGISGMSAGDSFLLNPAGQGARAIEVALTRPNEIAWASPISAGEAVDASGQALNSGSGKIGAVSFSGDVAALLGAGLPGDQITLSHTGIAADGSAIFSSDYGNVSYDAATASYTLALPGGIGEIRFKVSGSPAEGDAFVIQPNTKGRGDNANLLALAGIKDKPVLNGGDASLEELYSSLVGRAGAQTLRANINRDAQGVLLEQAQAARDAVSGVNLEEEAADMLRYQQAYMASAQMITVANSLFQSLLDAVR